jgi:Inhibitor of the KinA pathway to sporulation, predicted exonuclease
LKYFLYKEKEMKTTDKILIIDLEATCWDGKVPTGQRSEIIEIGISLLDTVSGEICESRSILIKPRHSEVSLFCTELTTITQKLLDEEGIGFTQACDILRAEYSQYTWASYGAYDINMMQSQCRERGVWYPLSEDHINVKMLFAERKGLKKRVGMAGALYILDIPLEGTHHRGIDDAKNIAKILYWCLKN